MRATLVLMIALAVVPALTAAEEPLATRVFDVSAILAPPREAEPMRLDLYKGVSVYTEEEAEAAPPEPFLNESTLDTLVMAFVDPAKWTEAGCGTSVSGGVLRVTAAPATLDAVGALLTALWAESAMRVEIEAEFATFPDARSSRVPLEKLRSGRLDPDTKTLVLAEAAKPGNTLAAGTAVARSGQRAEVRQTTSTTYVRDIDVEIAQGSTVGDPVVVRASEGWALCIRPTILLDGTVLLEALHQTAALAGPIRRISVEAEPLGTIDLPALSIERYSGAARVRPGETAAFVREGSGEPGPLTVLLLTPRIVGDRQGNAPAEFLPVGALLAGRDAACPAAVVPEEEDVVALPARALPEDLVHAPVLLLPRRPPVIEALEWLVPGIAEGTAILAGRGHLVFRAGDPAVAKAREAIAALEARAARTFRVHLGLREAGEAGVVAGISTLHLTVPGGAEAMFQAGTERAYLADWDVEVAQEARVGDPVARTTFGGFYGGLRLDATPDGKAVAGSIALVLADLAETFETRRPGIEKVGVIEIPTIHHVAAQREFALVPGSGPLTIDLGRGASGTRVELMISVEEL